MKTNQKTMRLIAVLLVLVMMICASACSGSDVDERQSRETGKATPTEKQKDPAPTEGEKDPTPTEGVPEATPTPTPEPVKLTIWVDSAERDFDWQVFDKAVNEMRELHPEILVQLEGMDHYTYETKLSAAVDFGALPDIFLLNPNSRFMEMVKDGLLCNMDDAALVYGNKLPDSMKQSFSVNGKLYAAPCETSSILMFANMEVLSKIGYTEVPATWDEFLKCCDELAAAGITPCGCSGREQWCMTEYLEYIMLRTGGRDMLYDIYYNGATWNNNTIADAVDLFRNMGQKGYFAYNMYDMNNDTVKQKFLDNEYAFYVNGTWNVEVFENTEDNRIRVVPFPGFGNPESGIGDYIGGAVAALAVPTTSLNAEEAVPYALELSRLISKYQQLTGGLFPVWEIDYDCSNLSEMRRSVAIMLLEANSFIYFADSALSPDDASAYLYAVSKLSFYDSTDGAEFIKEMSENVR